MFGSFCSWLLSILHFCTHYQLLAIACVASGFLLSDEMLHEFLTDELETIYDWHGEYYLPVLGNFMTQAAHGQEFISSRSNWRRNLTTRSSHANVAGHGVLTVSESVSESVPGPPWLHIWQLLVRNLEDTIARYRKRSGYQCGVLTWPRPQLHIRATSSSGPRNLMALKGHSSEPIDPIVKYVGPSI